PTLFPYTTLFRSRARAERAPRARPAAGAEGPSGTQESPRPACLRTRSASGRRSRRIRRRVARRRGRRECRGRQSVALLPAQRRGGGARGARSDRALWYRRSARPLSHPRTGEDPRDHAPIDRAPASRTAPPGGALRPRRRASEMKRSAAARAALAVALLVFTLGRSRGQLEPARALLVGVVFNSFASALVLSVEAVLRPDQMQAVSLWLAGALGYEAMPLLTGAALALVVPALVLVALAGRLNLLALGDEGAAALGVDVGRTRLLAFFAASAAVGIAVAFTGLVGFVGLIVPHAVRLLTGPDHRVVPPGSALGGAAF